MQGSHIGPVLHDQDYRERIKRLIVARFPDAEVYDPRADHAESIGYDDTTGRRVFFQHNLMCRQVDVLLAFVPEASMGSAIEMWEAYQHGAAVIAISPMAHNWAIRFLSHAMYADVEELEAAVADGRLARTIEQVRIGRGQGSGERGQEGGEKGAEFRRQGSRKTLPPDP